MKDFNWTQFSKRIYVNADVKTVYDFWTKSNDLEKWFLSKASFSSQEGSTILPTENTTSQSTYKWNWFAQNHAEEGSIIKVNGTDYIEFTFAGNCRVVVELSKEGNQTLINLTQTEIPLDDNSKENIRLGCAFGWSFYLLNLKSVSEGGLDLRNKDIELMGVVNN